MMKTARTTIKIRFWMILEKSRRDKKNNTVKTVENILNNVKRYKDKYGEKAQGHKFRFSNTILHILTVFTSFHFQ